MHALDNNILHNLPILWEDVRMAEDIYGPSVPYLQGKTVCYKVYHVEPIIVPNVPKGILDIYNNITLFWDLIHINGIGFINITPWYIMYAMGSTIKIKE